MTNLGSIGRIIREHSIVFVAVASVVLLSLPPIVVRISTGEVAQVVFVRFLTHLFIVGTFVIVTKKVKFGHFVRDFPLYRYTLSAAAFFFYLTLLFLAVRLTRPDVAIIVSTTGYLVAAGWTKWRKIAQLDRRARLSSLSCVVLGLTLSVASVEPREWKGVLIAMLAAVGYLGYLRFGEGHKVKLGVELYQAHAIIVAALGVVFSYLVLVVFYVDALQLSTEVLSSGVLIGLLSGIGHLGISYLLHNLSFVSVAFLSSLSPILSAVVAVFLFRDVGASLAFLGIFLVLIGVLISQLKKT